jgi:hypothetical protein
VILMSHSSGSILIAQGLRRGRCMSRSDQSAGPVLDERSVRSPNRWR